MCEALTSDHPGTQEVDLEAENRRLKAEVARLKRKAEAGEDDEESRKRDRTNGACLPPLPPPPTSHLVLTDRAVPRRPRWRSMSLAFSSRAVGDAPSLSLPKVGKGR